MKKKFLTVVLSLFLSLSGTSSVLAEDSNNPLIESSISILATEGYVEVPPHTRLFTGVVDGMGQYGRITLTSEGDAAAFMWYNCNNSGWVMGTNGNDGAYLYTREGSRSTDTTSYYMNRGCQYKMEVAPADKGAKGYIRAYD